MKIELKGLKIFLAGSRETICFTADIYIDGIRAAEARNDGQGGCTLIEAYEGKRYLLKTAEVYCKNLPGIKSEYSEGDLPMDLELFINDMVGKEADKKEYAKTAKKAEKSMLVNMLFTKEDNYLDGYYEIPLINSATKKKMPIEELLKMPKGIDALKKTISEQIAKGARLVNTNIPAHIYK